MPHLIHLRSTSSLITVFGNRVFIEPSLPLCWQASTSAPFTVAVSRRLSRSYSFIVHLCFTPTIHSRSLSKSVHESIPPEVSFLVSRLLSTTNKTRILCGQSERSHRTALISPMIYAVTVEPVVLFQLCHSLAVTWSYLIRRFYGVQYCIIDSSTCSYDPGNTGVDENLRFLDELKAAGSK